MTKQKKFRLIGLISMIIVLIASFVLAISFALYSDKKSADMNITVATGEANITASLEPEDLIAGNYFEKEISINFKTSKNINFRMGASVLTKALNSEGNEVLRSDIVSLVGVNSAIKGNDNMFYYSTTNSTTISSVGSGIVKVKFGFYVSEKANDELFRNSDGSQRTDLKTTITYVVEYAEENAPSWAGTLSGKTGYLVEWKVDDKIFKLDFVQAGVTPTAPDAVTKPETDTTEYVFASWSPTISAISANTAYSASFSEKSIIAEFPRTWYTEITSSLGLTGISTATDITGIRLDNFDTVPSEYQDTGKTLTCGIKIYQSASNKTDISFVYKKIKTPASCGNMFYWYVDGTNDVSFTNLTSLIFKNFDTTNMTNAFQMFRGLSALKTLDIACFNTSKVTSMQSMFHGCSELTTLNLSSFDTSNVTGMRWMFSGCSKLTTLNLSNFDTNKVTDMRNMFNSCASLINMDLSNFRVATSSGVMMSFMFANCTNLESVRFQNIINATGSLQSMFSNCKNLKSVDLTGFNTSNVTSFQGMFAECNLLDRVDLRHFATGANLTTVQAMFYNCFKIREILFDSSKFTAKGSTNFNNMFENCRLLEVVDVSGFDTSSATAMAGMFQNCSKLKTIDVSGFNTSKVTNMQSMFSGCKNLTSLDLSSFDLSVITNVSNVSGTYNMINCVGLTELKLPKTLNDTHKLTLPTLSAGRKWYDNGKAETANGTTLGTAYNSHTFKSTQDDLTLDADWKTQIVTKSLGFTNISGIKSIRFDTPLTIPSDYTQKATLTSGIQIYGNGTAGYISFVARQIYSPKSSQELFRNCTAMTEIIFNNFNTSLTTDISGMFHTCSALKSIDLSSFDVSGITGGGLMNSLFSNCSNLESINLTGWDISNTKWFPNMFYGCSKLKSIDLSSFNNSIIINASNMFYGCSSLTTLDLSKIDFKSLTEQDKVANMLTGCTGLIELKAPKNIQSGISIALPTKTGYSWYEKGTTTLVSSLSSAQSGKTLEFCLTK